MTASFGESRPARRIGDFADIVLAFGAGTYLRHATLFGVLCFVAYMGIVALVAVAQPQMNWDGLAYVAIAIEHLHGGAAVLHEQTYGLVREGVDAAEFILLTQDGGYRTQMFTDPAGFVSMLGMYRVKWLYCEVLVLLSAILPPLEAIRAVSLASAMLFGAVVLLWLRSERTLALAPIMAALLLVAGFADMARGMSPDMMFSALLLAGLYAHVRKSELTAGVLLFASFLVRPDNLIFLGVYTVLLIAHGQRSWSVFGAFIAAALVFKPLTMLTGQPGWWEQLYFASVERQPTLEGFHPAFSVTLYLYALVKQFLLAMTAQTWIGVLVLGLAAWLAIDRVLGPLNKGHRLLMLALVLGVVAKFVLIPIFDSRIYFAYLVAMFLVLCSRIGEWRDEEARA